MNATQGRLLTADILTIAEACKELPSRPHVSTIWRWAMKGCRGHKLEFVMIGAVKYTSRQALNRFLTAIQA